MRTAWLLLALVPFASLHADTDPIATIAMAVHEQDAKALVTTLQHALINPDPRVREIAARVANVRNVTSLLDYLRAGLDRERDLPAAREEMRAMIALGVPRDIDRAVFISDRFEGHLDDAVAVAAGHLGQAAIDIYFDSLSKRDIDKGGLLRVALWGHPERVTAVASRLIASNDADAFTDLLFTIDSDPAELLDAKTLAAGLASTKKDIREETVWFLINRVTREHPMTIDAATKKTIATMELPKDNNYLLIGIEMLRRVIGDSKERVDLRKPLRESRLAQLRLVLSPRKVLDYLQPQERLFVFGGKQHLPDFKSKLPSPFVLPSLLPNGVAAAVMKATSCNEEWIGNAKVKIDSRGRVASADLSGVTTSDGCRRALDTFLKLSIAENTYISAPLESNAVFVAHAAKAPVCLDEGASLWHTKFLFGSPYISMPRLIDGEDPYLPPGSKSTSEEVVLEIVTTAEGCVRSVRVVTGSKDPAVNRAAVMAVSQWKFDAARSQAERVEIMFRMRLNVQPKFAN
jgi:TonB family protein